MLVLYRRVVFGKLEKPDVAAMPDLSAREVLIFAPMVALVFWMGIYPSTFLGPSNASVEKLIATYEQALAQAGSAAQVASR